MLFRSFSQIEEFAKEKGAYFLLKNTYDLKTKEFELDVKIKDEGEIEKEVIKVHSEQNPSDFNSLIQELIDVLSIEKQEGETSESFNVRLITESKRVLRF